MWGASGVGGISFGAGSKMYDIGLMENGNWNIDKRCCRCMDKGYWEYCKRSKGGPLKQYQDN